MIDEIIDEIYGSYNSYKYDTGTICTMIILHKYNYLLMAKNLVIMVWISVYLYACKRTQQLEQIFLSLNICTSKEQTVR